MRTVGKSITHDSADLHVSGTAIYIDDMREPEGTVHVAPGYAKEGARGKIILCDLSAVRAAAGVIAVFAAKDIPHKNDCSPTAGDDPKLLQRLRSFQFAIQKPICCHLMLLKKAMLKNPLLIKSSVN
jgi:xanthine dehydrogenase molybdopterin-binding subunit B